jgi:phospholipid:diacylglycerol acyltransferase
MADSAAGTEPQCVDPADGACAARTPFDAPLLRKSWIDAEYTDETLYPRIRTGVKLGEGDGTVSLVSLGTMSVKGWTRKRWNRLLGSRSPLSRCAFDLFFFSQFSIVKTTEGQLPHRPVSIPRGSANTSEHIDILWMHVFSRKFHSKI